MFLCGNMNWVDWYRGRRIVITGGLGFIGSNLARRLVELDARVRIIDAELPNSGANPHNLEGIAGDVDLWRADLRDRDVVEAMLVDQEVLFNLAAQSSHLASMEDPEIDLTVNAACHLAVVEAARKTRPDIKIVYTATRQAYGRSQTLPVAEAHAIDPIDYNGISKWAGEMFHLVAHRVYGLNATSLRLTNTYGPRMRCRDARLMFLGEWIRRLLCDEPVLIYGAGEQIRDLNYVDDVVTALLSAAAHPATAGRVYNLGTREPVRLSRLAEVLIATHGGGRIEYVPFPAERARIDIGDYQGDFSRIHDELAWSPRVSLCAGLRQTLAFVADHREHYL